MTIITQENDLVNYNNITRITTVQLSSDEKENEEQIYLLFGITNNSAITDSELETLAVQILNPASVINSAILDGVVFFGYFFSQQQNDSALTKIIDAIRNKDEIVKIPIFTSAFNSKDE